MLVFELDGVCKLFGFGVFVTIVHSVLYWQGVEVPSIEGMVCPRALFVRFFVDLYFVAHWGERHFVIVEWD